jgi:D-alanyl-D-alanine carboxypeptidase/D-alanyl-D-alanine-endopeptidase (penicillin-binding protein 4)
MELRMRKTEVRKQHSEIGLATLRFCFLLSALCVSSCATAPRLSNAIDGAISRPPFDRAIWAIRVEEDDGRVLYARNDGTLVMPASNRKLFAAATIAGCLGLDRRLETEIWLDGEDLVLRGDGDPSLGSWRYERQNELDDLAVTLRSRGVTRVRDVVADASAFDRVTIPGGWKHGNLGADYAAPVDALAWTENEIPVDRSVEDPPLHAATALRDALTLRGIEVAGVPRVNTEPRAWGEKLLTIPSPFVGHLLTTVLKNSHNLYAEMLFKRSSGGTYDGSFELERALLGGEQRLEPGTFRFVDGSGLAPDDLITTSAAIRLLRWMNDPLLRGLWWSLLARPGEEGTLRRRLAGLEERFAGKTGTINGVNALSGIVAMPGGRFRYLSIIVNHHTGDGDEALRIIDEIVRAVAGDANVPSVP